MNDIQIKFKTMKLNVKLLVAISFRLYIEHIARPKMNDFKCVPMR